MSKISNNLEAINLDLLAACFSLSGITDHACTQVKGAEGRKNHLKFKGVWKMIFLNLITLYLSVTYFNKLAINSHFKSWNPFFSMLLLSTAGLNHVPSLLHYITPRIPSNSSRDVANSLDSPTDHQGISPIFSRAVDPLTSATAGPFWRDWLYSVERMWPLYFSVREGHFRSKTNHVIWSSHVWNAFKSQQALGSMFQNKPLSWQWHFLYMTDRNVISDRTRPFPAVSNRTHL